MRSVFTVFALFALVVAGAHAADTAPAASSTPPDIHIYSCKVISGRPLVPQANEVGLAVRFQNHTSDTFSKILWRAKYGAGYVDFLDDGTFSPEVRIDNFLLFDIGKAHVNLLGLLFTARGNEAPIDSQVHFPEYAGMDNPENCQIIQTETNDGTVWKNPSVPEQHYVLPSPFPSNEATLPPGETAAKAPLDVAHCQLLYPYTHGNGQLNVGFRSVAPGKTASSVTFRLLYDGGTVDTVDSGAFEDGVYIRHGHVGFKMPDAMKGSSYFSFDDPARCVPVTVTYTDGTSWTNPNAPSPMPEPTKIPDALDYGLGEWAVNWHQGLALPAPSPSASPTP